MDPGDVDYFEIRVSTEGETRIIVESLSAPLQPQVLVYDTDKRQIASSTGYRSQVTPGQTVSVTFTATESPDYHVAVRSLGGDGPYRVRVEGN